MSRFKVSRFNCDNTYIRSLSVKRQHEATNITNCQPWKAIDYKTDIYLIEAKLKHPEDKSKVKQPDDSSNETTVTSKAFLNYTSGNGTITTRT